MNDYVANTQLSDMSRTQLEKLSVVLNAYNKLKNDSNFRVLIDFYTKDSLLQILNSINTQEEYEAKFPEIISRKKFLEFLDGFDIVEMNLKDELEFRNS